MAERHYIIDEDDSSNSYHEYVQATTALGSEEIVKEIVNEPSLEDPLGECFAQSKCDIYLEKVLEQAETFNEPSLEDPLEECFAQFECDLDLNMILDPAKTYWIPLLRCKLRMGKPLRYPSLTHLHQ